MDHLAGKATAFDVEDSWKADMYQAAAAPGVHIKVSDTHKLSAQAVTGAPAGLIQFQPIADPEPYEPTLEFLFRTSGEDRLIFFRDELACERRQWNLCRHFIDLPDQYRREFSGEQIRWFG